MNLSLLTLLRCPMGCDGDLELDTRKRRGSSQIIEGTLTCKVCGREYPIEEGIVRMLTDTLSGPCGICGTGAPAAPAKGSDEATERKLSEMQARDAQVKDYDRMWYLNLFGAVEIPLTLRHLQLKRKHNLLEAGCGTGRMTRRFAAKCNHLVSIDFSWESLRVCGRKLHDAGVKNVDLIQADLCHIPLRTEVFDRVVSCQVLEHIPTPESRKMAIGELARVVRPGRRLVISAYQNSLLAKLFGKKEGEHDGGIYFFRFEKRELRDLLSTALHVETITGTLVYHYIAACRKSGRVNQDYDSRRRHHREVATTSG